MTSMGRDIGYLMSEEPIFVMDGGDIKLGTGKLEMDVVGCRHCGAVIRVFLKDYPGAAEPKRRCVHCDGPICKYCFENLLGSKGNCFPIAGQIAFKVQHGVWPHEMGILDFRAVR